MSYAPSGNHQLYEYYKSIENERGWNFDRAVLSEEEIHRMLVVANMVYGHLKHNTAPSMELHDEFNDYFAKYVLDIDEKRNGYSYSKDLTEQELRERRGAFEYENRRLKNGEFSTKNNKKINTSDDEDRQQPTITEMVKMKLGMIDDDNNNNEQQLLLLDQLYEENQAEILLEQENTSYLDDMADYETGHMIDFPIFVSGSTKVMKELHYSRIPKILINGRVPFFSYNIIDPNGEDKCGNTIFTETSEIFVTEPVNSNILCKYHENIDIERDYEQSAFVLYSVNNMTSDDWNKTNAVSRNRINGFFIRKTDSPKEGYFLAIHPFKSHNEVKRVALALKEVLSPDAIVEDCMSDDEGNAIPITLFSESNALQMQKDPFVINWRHIVKNEDLPFTFQGRAPKNKSGLDFSHPFIKYVIENIIKPGKIPFRKLRHRRGSRFEIQWTRDDYLQWDWDYFPLEFRLTTRGAPFVDLRKILKETEEGRKLIRQCNVMRMDGVSKFDVRDTIKVEANYFGESPVVLETLSNFYSNKHFKFLGIKGNMGTGKSYVINLLHNANKKKRVLFISPRRSLSTDITKKYKDVKDYRYMQDYEPGESLVCQIDSITKINLKHFDTVIIDEFESVIEHLSGLKNNENYEDIISTFYDLTRDYSKKFVLVDAFLNNHSVKSIFGSYIDIKVLQLNKPDDTQILYTQNDKTFMNTFGAVLKDRKQGEIITVSCSKLSKVVNLVQICRDQNLKVAELSSRVSEARKLEVYQEMSKNNPSYDVLIYSPSVTVGVEILNKNSTYHFHWDIWGPISVLASMQMLKRNRNAKTIITCVIGKPRCNLPWWNRYATTDPNTLEEEMYHWDNDTYLDVFMKGIEYVYNYYAREPMLYPLLLNNNFKNVKEIQEYD